MTPEQTAALSAMIRRHRPELVAAIERLNPRAADYFRSYLLRYLDGWSEKAEAGTLSDDDVSRLLFSVTTALKELCKKFAAEAAGVEPLRAELATFKKSFDARALRNEAATREAVNMMLDALRTRDASKAGYLVADNDTCKHVDDLEGGIYDFVDCNQAAVVVGRRDNGVYLRTMNTELADRLAAEAVAQLKKAFGKPTGSQRSKSFKKGRQSISVDSHTVRHECGSHQGSVSIYGAAQLFEAAELRL